NPSADLLQPQTHRPLEPRSVNPCWHQGRWHQAAWRGGGGVLLSGEKVDTGSDNPAEERLKKQT
ncbi:hypothetical protein NHX12_006604, partial [Muraenolepis orangiensis]